MSNSLWPHGPYVTSLGSSVHGISQAGILEWLVIPFSRGSSWPRDRTWVSHLTGGFFDHWATREAPCYRVPGAKCQGASPPTTLTYHLPSLLFSGQNVCSEASPPPKPMAWAPTWSLRSASTTGSQTAERRRRSGRSWPWTPTAPARRTAWTPCSPMAPPTTSPAPPLQTSCQVSRAQPHRLAIRPSGFSPRGLMMSQKRKCFGTVLGLTSFCCWTVLMRIACSHGQISSASLLGLQGALLPILLQALFFCVSVCVCVCVCVCVAADSAGQGRHQMKQSSLSCWCAVSTPPAEGSPVHVHPQGSVQLQQESSRGLWARTPLLGDICALPELG